MYSIKLHFFLVTYRGKPIISLSSFIDFVTSFPISATTCKYSWLFFECVLQIFFSRILSRFLNQLKTT